jgi:hypothetical protein
MVADRSDASEGLLGVEHVGAHHDEIVALLFDAAHDLGSALAHADLPAAGLVQPRNRETANLCCGEQTASVRRIA